MSVSDFCAIGPSALARFAGGVGTHATDLASAEHGLALAAACPGPLVTRGAHPEWESTDKTPRRAFVASHHGVLMLFGDDLNDFTAARGKSLAEREAIVRAHATDWGRKWFALSNPVTDRGKQRSRAIRPAAIN